MIKATNIDITRGEGRRDMDFDTHTFSTWAEANAQIAAIAKTVEGHADKVDFAIYFEDGYIYNGTICVKNADLHEEESLSDHIRQHLAFEMGIAKPAHLSEAQYAEFNRNREAHSPELLTEVANFATNYQIG